MGIYPSFRDALGGYEHAKSSPVMLTSGFVCGSLAYLIAAPLWLMKTRCQADAQLAIGVLYPSTVAEFWCGCGPLVLRGALLSGGQMLGYDGTKTVAKREGWARDGPLLHVQAATAAALCSATFSAPADVVMCRVQTDPASVRLVWAIRSVWKEEGFRGFFRGWVANVSRLMPTFVVGANVYEQTRLMLGLSFME